MFNWQKRKIIREHRTPPAYFDSEEYEFLRLCYHYSGARGITANHRCIFVALQNTIQIYDKEFLTTIGRIDHPLFNGIHEIYWFNDRLYVTCAVTDSILVMSEEGRELEHFYLGNNPFFIDALALCPRQLDSRVDYRLMHRVKRLFHVNNVQVKDKDIYTFFNLQGCFAKIHPQEEIIIRDKTIIQGHNAQFSPDGKYILINDTGNYTLRVYDSQRSLLHTVDLREFPLPVNFSRQQVFGRGHEIKSGWLRGMAFSAVDEKIVYLGLSPAMVIAVNYLKGELVDYFRFRKNTWISIHGLHNLSRNDI